MKPDSQRRKLTPPPLYKRGMFGIKYKMDVAINKKKEREYPVVENIVAVVDTHASLDLPLICSTMKNTDNRPKYFAAASVRIGKNTVLIYSTGKFLVAGSKSYEEIMYIAHLYLLVIGRVRERIIEYYPGTRRIKRYRYQPIYERFLNRTTEIANIVGKTYHENHTIHLNQLYSNYRECGMFSPYRFPAFRLRQPEFSSLIFDTKYVLYLGLKHIDQLQASYRVVQYMIEQAEKDSDGMDIISYYLWVLAVSRQRRLPGTRPNSKESRNAGPNGGEMARLSAPVLSIERIRDAASNQEDLQRRDRFEKRVQSFYNHVSYRYMEPPDELMKVGSDGYIDVRRNGSLVLNKLRKRNPQLFMERVDGTLFQQRSRDWLMRHSSVV